MTDDTRKLEALLDQERELQFPAFDCDTAWRLGSLLRRRAAEGGKPVAIDISKNGQQLFFCALPGANADNSDWVRRKSAVVNRFQHSSLYMRFKAESGGKSFPEKYLLDERDFAAHGGSFPLLLEGSGCVGTITVSGLPQVEDHEFLVSTLREFLAAEKN
ncbi:MAG TPA: heme-degrading domain-containing protein [Arenibaculum sp.]|nr:heme-degrading domain-containing protein [Arenibaculum sp.]